MYSIIGNLPYILSTDVSLNSEQYLSWTLLVRFSWVKEKRKKGIFYALMALLHVSILLK